MGASKGLVLPEILNCLSTYFFTVVKTVSHISII